MLHRGRRGTMHRAPTNEPGAGEASFSAPSRGKSVGPYRLYLRQNGHKL